MHRWPIICLILASSFAGAGAQDGEPPLDLAARSALQFMVPAGWWTSPRTVRAADDAWPLLSVESADRPVISMNFLEFEQARSDAEDMDSTLSGEQVTGLAEWLDTRAECLRRIRLACERAGINRPALAPASSQDERWEQVISDCVRNLAIDARVRAAQGDRRTAWSDAVQAQYLASWVADAALTDDDQRTAERAQCMAAKLMARLAQQATGKDEERLLLGALAAIPPARDIDVVACLRRSIAAPHFLDKIARAPLDGPGWRLVLIHQQSGRALLNVSAAWGVPTSPPPSPVLDAVGGKGVLLERQQTLRTVLDWCSTVTAQAPATWRALNDAAYSPAALALSRRVLRVRPLLWMEFDPKRMIDLSDDEGLKNRLQDERDLVLALQRLCDQDGNPCGSLLADRKTLNARYAIADQVSCERLRRCARTALMIAVVRLRSGALPRTLDAVVGPGLLDALPLNPGDRSPMIYNSRAGTLSCIEPIRYDDERTIDGGPVKVAERERFALAPLPAPAAAGVPAVRANVSPTAP